ncbi:MAG: hypothetical protein O7G87_07945 [bacterium]|nr:hypothetical protein [bacterium]
MATALCSKVPKTALSERFNWVGLNWNRYDGVSPSSLRVMRDGKIKRLPSGEQKAFDARSSVKSEWRMAGEAAEKIGGQLTSQVLQVLDTYRPETAHAAR